MTTGAPRATLVRLALLEGVYIWTAVAVIERLLGWLLIQLELLEVLPAQPPLAALWWYPAAGMVSGALAGLVARGDAETRARRTRTLLLLSVVAAFTVAGVVSLQTLTSRLALSLCALVLVPLLLQLSDPRGRLVRALDGASPATVAVLLSLPAWHRLNVPFPDARINFSTTIVSIGVAAVALHALIAAVRAWARPRPSRPLVRAIGAVALFVAITAAGQAQRVPALEVDRVAPDVVLVVLDTVRADHLATYGYPRNTMPTLEAFGRSATVYENAIAAADMTLSSHASMFTGVYPFRHGAYVRVANPVGLPVSPRYPMLAEMLAARGYRPHGVAANWSFLGPTYGFHRGFDAYEWDPASSVHVLERVALALRFGFSPPPYAPAARITDKSIHAVTQAANRPLMLFANYLDAHMPNAPPQSFVEAIERAPVPPIPPTRGALGGRLSPSELRSRIDWYDASLAYVDRELSRLFDHLRAVNRFDSALIIVTSDHGELLGEDGLFGHGRGTADALIRVPLIVKYVGQRSGARVDDLVSHVDIAPTVLEAVGAPAPAATDGIDLAASGATRPHPVISMSFPEGSGFETAVYTASGKLVILPSGSVLATIDGRPVINPTIASADRATVDALIAAAHAMAPLGESRLSPEARERLRALGYVR